MSLLRLDLGDRIGLSWDLKHELWHHFRGNFRKYHLTGTPVLQPGRLGWAILGRRIRGACGHQVRVPLRTQIGERYET